MNDNRLKAIPRWRRQIDALLEGPHSTTTLALVGLLVKLRDEMRVMEDRDAAIKDEYKHFEGRGRGSITALAVKYSLSKARVCQIVHGRKAPAEAPAPV